jgi:fumarylacetoacetase
VTTAGVSHAGTINATHDARRSSWVASANDGATDFPIQNLPLGVFRRAGGTPQGGVAIGDQILDLSAALAAGLLSGMAAEAGHAAAGACLNPLMVLGNEAASALRHQVSDLLSAGSAAARLAATLLVPAQDVAMMLPADVGSFTDFLTSQYHTERGGRHTRPEQPLPVNFKHLPVAYNSRATSVRVSGEAVRRPRGQFQRSNGEVVFAACEQLDFELELGLFVGVGNALGEPVSIAGAAEKMFGFCLLNDWSARDIQRWESVPLGPFLSKSLSTTISPWVVTVEAMAPFRAAALARDAADPRPLPYLFNGDDQRAGGMDVDMEVYLLTPRMRAGSMPPVRITRTNFRHMYWTFGQMLTHHTSNGCNLRPGDLLGSGTASGPTDESRACLAELSERGTESYDIGHGEQRRFLEDGDEVIFRARASRPDFVSIGFGECRGRIEPAPSYPIDTGA